MNDRYLYRAKRTDNVEWVEGYYCRKFKWAADKYPVPAIQEKDIFSFRMVDQTTICQCTGLKDKNGKLIWENDIMVAHLDDRFPEDATYTRVVWNNNGFCTKEQGSEDISPLDKFDQEHFEVCGNIFDNPELLEVEE